MAENKVHTHHITNAGAIALHSICKDTKGYTEPMELQNAGMIARLLEQKLPMIKKLAEFKPDEGAEAWLEKSFTWKLYEDMRDTAKKSIVAHIKSGTFIPSDGVNLLLSELGVTPVSPSIAALLVEDAQPTV